MAEDACRCTNMAAARTSASAADPEMVNSDQSCEDQEGKWKATKPWATSAVVGDAKAAGSQVMVAGNEWAMMAVAEVGGSDQRRTES